MKMRSRIPVVLASTSPRRVDLMSQIQIECSVVSPASEEIPRIGEKPKALVARLAKEKAESVRAVVFENYGPSLIISADTIVVAPDGKTILGKPKNEKEAKAMLSLLAGKTHSVYTGYCICHVKKSPTKNDAKPLKKAASLQSFSKLVVRVVRSKVKMRKLTSESIRRYVATGEPLDKAGSYGAQGIGTALVEKIEGSYTNVVGLPMAELVADLEKFNLKLFSWIK